MPNNNFKLFDQNKANLLSDTEYANATQRLNGVQTGVASSQLQNKFAYQVSLVAYAIAQIMNQNGLNATDTLSVSAFVGNLGGALLQKVADKASSAEAAAGVATGKWMSPALVKAAMEAYTSGKWLPLTGGTMTGNLFLNADPTTNLGAATKQYVDSGISTLSSKFASVKLLDKTVTDATAASTSYTYTVSQAITNFNKIVVYVLDVLREHVNDQTNDLKLFGGNVVAIGGNFSYTIGYGAFYSVELIKSANNSFSGYFTGMHFGYDDKASNVTRIIHIDAANVNKNIVMTTGSKVNQFPSSFRLLVYGYKNI